VSSGALEEVPAAFSPSDPVLVTVMPRVVLADLPVRAARRHPAGDWRNRMAKLMRRGQRHAGRQEPNPIVESSHDAIVGITRAGIVTDWNPAAARLYGYAPEEIIGRSVEVLYPPERGGE